MDIDNALPAICCYVGDCHEHELTGLSQATGCDLCPWLCSQANEQRTACLGITLLGVVPYGSA